MRADIASAGEWDSQTLAEYQSSTGGTMQVVDLSLVIDLSTIVLSAVAIVLTVIGFFASLRFYRDGVELQSRVSELLSRVDERISSVQSQVGGMFERTLDAALLGTSAKAAAHEQRRLIDESDAGTAVDDPLAAGDPDLAKTVLEYFAFRKLRYTDVATGDARAVFMLGADHGFNLFDSPSEVVFFGYFHETVPKKIVMRVRFLMGNIESGHGRLESAEGEIRETARRLLHMLNIEVLVPEDADAEKIEKAIQEYQPPQHRIPLKILKPSEIRAVVEQEYGRMEF